MKSAHQARRQRLGTYFKKITRDIYPPHQDSEQLTAANALDRYQKNIPNQECINPVKKSRI